MASPLPESTAVRTCRTCAEVKPDGQFYVRDKRTGRRDTECKPCSLAKLRAVREKRGPREWRDAYLKSTFGITQADYDAMHDVQGGACALCGTAAEQSYKGLHIDHDHDTGRVRGLLCQRCNMALGLFDDNVTVLAEAIAYITRARASA